MMRLLSVAHYRGDWLRQRSSGTSSRSLFSIRTRVSNLVRFPSEGSRLRCVPLVAHALGQRNGLQGVTFPPDGSLVASAVFDCTAKLWDIASRRLLRSLRHAGEVTAVIFSSDGAALVSAGYDSQVCLWGVPC